MNKDRIKFLAYEVWRWGELAEVEYFDEIVVFNEDESELFVKYIHWFEEDGF